jgi:hypothetical protein
VTAIVGAAVFYATNRALPMLDLSGRYAAATTDVERAALVSAGRAMLAVGQSHTPGTFPAFFVSEVAGIGISVVMLRGGVFSRASAWMGIVGFGLLLVYDVLASFVPPAADAAMTVAIGGGLSNLVWHVLTARRLFALAQG